MQVIDEDAKREETMQIASRKSQLETFQSNQNMWRGMDPLIKLQNAKSLNDVEMFWKFSKSDRKRYSRYRNLA